MIEFTNVSKRYVTKKALNNVSFTLPEGKIIGIVGENGSGKSTILKLMAGLLQPTEGNVRINGEQVTRKICESVSYLSELESYYPFYTVKEHVIFYESQFFDFNKEKADEILAFMNIDQGVKMKHLSKGNRGRVKIALALARKVPIILMDEPFSGLDPMARDAIVKGLLSFVDLETQTVVMTTHEIKEIEPLLDVVALIKDGEILKIQDVEEIKIEHQLGIVDWMKEMYRTFA